MSRRADVGRPGEFAVGPALEELGNLCGCRVGVCAAGLEGPLAGVTLGFGEDEASPSASLIKVLVIAELLRQADSGSLSLAEEVFVRPEDLVEDSEMLGAKELPGPVSCWGLAEGMITVSDNAATNLLIRRVGAGNVNVLAGGLGLRRTSLRRVMMDFGARSRGEENTTSASDMVALMRELRAGSTLTDGSRNLALGPLLAQRLVSKIEVPLPPGARYAHKTGELEGVENDAGRDRSRAGPELRVGRAGRGGREARGGACVGGAARPLPVLRRRGRGCRLAGPALAG